MANRIQKAFDGDLILTEGDRCFLCRMCSDACDRDGEVCLPSGMVTTEFEANPVVFYQHDYARLPLGSVVGIKRTDAANYAKVQVATRPENHEGEWMPDTIYSLIQQKVLRGVSVAFEAIERRNPTAKDRTRFGEQAQNVYSKWNLLELTITGLPANQEALILAVSKSMTPAIAKRLGFAAKEPEPAPPAIIREVAFPIREVTFSTSKAFEAPQLPNVEVIVKQAIAKKMGKIFV